MGVVACNRLPRLDAQTRDQRITEVYQIVTDSGADTFAEVRLAPELPQMGNTHPDFMFLVVQDVRYEQREDLRILWLVQVEYGYGLQTVDAEERKNPVNVSGTDPGLLFKWRTLEIARAQAKDQNDNPYWSTAGVPYDPPPTFRAYNLAATFSRYELTFSGSAMLSYIGHTNSGTFLGGAAESVLCTGIEADLMYLNSAPIYRVTYQFEYNTDPSGWRFRCPSMGYQELKSGAAKPSDCKDEDGNTVTQPQYLTEDGEQLDADDVKGNPALIHYQNFKPYPTANFSALNLV